MSKSTINRGLYTEGLRPNGVRGGLDFNSLVSHAAILCRGVKTLVTSGRFLCIPPKC